MSRILSEPKKHKQRSYTWYRKGTGSDISFWNRICFTSHDSITSLLICSFHFLQLLCIPNELSDIQLLQLINLNRLHVLSYHILKLSDQQTVSDWIYYYRISTFSLQSYLCQLLCIRRSILVQSILHLLGQTRGLRNNSPYHSNP